MNRRMTKREFLANRKAAGRVIDVETCDIVKTTVNLADPYGVDRRLRVECIGRVLFVASAQSGGWILVEDLPEDERLALKARIERGDVDDDVPF